MRKEIRYLIVSVIIFLICASVVVSGEEKLTLEQFITNAIRDNESIRIAMEAISGAEAKILESKSQYLPQITLSANYSRVSNTGELQMPLNGEMRTFKFSTPNNLSMKLGISEQVFNWGKTAKTIKLNEIGTAISQENVNQVKLNISYQLVPIFYGILFTNQAIKVLDDTSNLFKQKLEIARERYKVGLASDFDLSLLEVQISTINSQKLDLFNNIRKWNLIYNRIAGRPSEAIFEPEGVLDFEVFDIKTGDLLAEADVNRVDVKILDHQDIQAKTQEKIVETNNKPTVTALLNYEFRNGIMPEITKIKGTWSAVLSASYPLFDGHKTRAQLTQVRTNINIIEKQKNELQKTIELEIKEGIEDIKTIEQKIDIEKIKISHAEKALKIAEERFRNGMISTTDFIDSQTSLENARLNHLQLIFNHILSRYSIFRSVGRRLCE